MAKDTDIKRTAGQIVYDELIKEPKLIADPIGEIYDARTESLKDYVRKLESTIADGLKVYSGDFFIQASTKAERTLQIVIRNLIFHKRACPTPTYDQKLYKYNRANDKVEFLWSIPDKATCEWMKTCPFEVPEAHRELLQTVLDFYDRTLDRITMKLNGEDDSNQDISKIVEEIYG